MDPDCDHEAIPVPDFATCPGRCWNDKDYRHDWIPCQPSEQIGMGANLTDTLAREGTK
jgi:hypothetical protein